MKRLHYMRAAAASTKPQPPDQMDLMATPPTKAPYAEDPSMSRGRKVASEADERDADTLRP